MLRSCVLCPRRCRVDRTAGERGYCGLGVSAVTASALPHHGEEPPEDRKVYTGEKREKPAKEEKPAQGDPAPPQPGEK